MKTSLYIFLIFLVTGFYHSCVKAPNFDDTPSIEFISFSRQEINQGSLNNDSLFVIISFTDGDGDLGERPEVATTNLFLTDNRTGEIYNRFKIPTIPEEGVGNGISGEIKINLFTTCCIFPDNIPPCESPDLYPSNDLSFDIYIVDRAGNKSQTITTPALTLLCN